MTHANRARTLVVLFALCATLVGCWGGGSTSEIATCSVERSELGPFSPETALGSTISEAEARSRMAQDDIVVWLAITAEGPWDRAWETATSSLGPGIHRDLSWLDVDGQISNLYVEGDAFGFSDLRVSRSFQGKIEHSREPLFLPLQDDAESVNFAAGCTITAVDVGDAENEQLLDVKAVTS